MAGDFSDDEWDIPDDELEVLENNAVTSTQQQPRLLQTNRPTHASRLSSADLSKTERYPSTTVASGSHNRPSAHSLDNAKQLRQDDSFEKVSLDEDGMPLVVEAKEPQSIPRSIDETTAREQWRVNRFSDKRPPPQPAYRQPVYGNYQQPSQHAMGATSGSFGSQSSHFSRHRQNNDADEALRAKVVELEKDRELLAKSLEAATNELRTAKGEITIIRENNSREFKTSERQMVALRKQMQEDSEKHLTTVQTKDAMYSELNIQSKYLKHDLDEQLRKVQSLQRQLKERPLQDRPNDVNLTPRKTHVQSLRDGFDDDEVMTLSPVKSPAKGGRRSKPGTPTNRKRKQPGVDDPIALQLKLSTEASGDDPGESAPKQSETRPPSVSVVVQKDHTVEHHLRFLQKVLNFHPGGGPHTLVEKLMDFSFPSLPTKSLSSILLAQASTLTGERFPGDLLQMFIGLMSQAYEEHYHAPISLLLETVEHVLDIEPLIIDTDIVMNLVKTLEHLAYINARVRWALHDRNRLAELKNSREMPEMPAYEPAVSTTACLNILFTVANLIVDSPELIELFWKCMQTDFVLLLLSSSQTIPDIILMLSIVETSITPTHFGNVCNEQDKLETYILDKTSFLLYDTPKPIPQRISAIKNRILVVPNAPCEKVPTRLQICDLRLKVLHFLGAVAVTSSYPLSPKRSLEHHHGTTLIALKHPNCLARLVRSAYDELSHLYRTNPAVPTHTLHAQLVNQATAIIHHVLTSPQALGTAPGPDGSRRGTELSKMMAAVPVGMHKFRVVMSRLAFREGTGPCDGLITERTREMAEEVLEVNVGPDEAVGLLEAFGRMEVDAEETPRDEEMEE